MADERALRPARTIITRFCRGKYRALTTDGVDQALARMIDPKALMFVVVGDAAKVRPQLDKLGMPVEVIEAP